jgi:hypothetical protein
MDLTYQYLLSHFFTFFERIAPLFMIPALFTEICFLFPDQ